MVDMMKKVLEAMQRRMIRLQIGVDGPVIWGRTRFGGQPDVPADFQWPTYVTDTAYDETVKPRPLAFLAQIDCGALACMDPEGLLPRRGLLSFFYEMDSARWGYDPADAGSARVYWFEAGQPLHPAAFPAELEEEFRLPRLPVQAGPGVSFAAWEDFFQIRSDVPLMEPYEHAYEAMGGSGNCTKLLGWPDVLQDNMTLPCELVSAGYNLTGLEEIPEELVRRKSAEALQHWRLLFQLNGFSAGDFDLDFGETGALYFYIRTEDLRARRFDRVWAILQCD